MKTIVLALDALDHRLVKEWNFTEFQQKVHGTYDVKEIEAISTPICFSAILTGEDPRKYGYTLQFILKEGYNPLLRPLFWFRMKFLRDLKSTGFRKRARKKGLFNVNRRNMTDKMKKKSIFHRISEMGFTFKADNVPSYNEIPQENFRGEMLKFVGKPFALREEFIRENVTSVRKRWIDNVTNFGDVNLTFIYSQVPDYAHHLVHHIDEISMVKRTYDTLRDLPFLFELQNIAVLILSDHGYQHLFDDETGKDIEGGHSNKGFWSTNVEIEKEPESVFDIHDLILELVMK
jgi:hypothetical protein